MPKLRLSPRERKSLATAERVVRQMRANAVSHGSIQPRVKSKRVCGWLDKSVKHGKFTITQSINGKKYMVTYSATKHFKNGDWVVGSYAREMLGDRKLGKVERPSKIYAERNGIWMEVNIGWL